jgi:hypothetical protein
MNRQQNREDVFLGWLAKVAPKNNRCQQANYRLSRSLD